MMFKLTCEHVKLLRHAYVSWDNCETGAPCIDPKRPYGNSYVAGDVYEILHGDRDRHELTDDEEREMLELHYETKTALQVVLSAGSFRPGTYEREDYMSWRRAR